MTIRIVDCPERRETTPSVEQIKRWYDATFSNPKGPHIQNQLSLHFEEVSGMLRVLSDASESLPELKQLSLAQHVLNNFRRQTTLSDIEKIVEDIDRVSLLKLLCDQIVSSIGIAHLMRLDIEGALQEVASANLKMLGKDGRPVFTVAVGFSQRPTLSRADFAPFIAMPEKES